MRKQGKKIDVLEIVHGAHNHKVELRLDKTSGKFSAELGGETFEVTNLTELKKLLQAKAEQMASYEFRWYIDIDLSFQKGSRRSSYGVDFEDLVPEELCQLGFSFDVYERSQMIETDETDYRGRKLMCRLERQLVERDGKLVPDEQSHVGAVARASRGEGEFRRVHVTDGRDDSTIEYTPERYAKLVAIRAGLYELARRLHEVVGDSKKAALSLDGASVRQLLLAGGK